MSLSSLQLAFWYFYLVDLAIVLSSKIMLNDIAKRMPITPIASKVLVTLWLKVFSLFSHRMLVGSGASLSFGFSPSTVTLDSLFLNVKHL